MYTWPGYDADATPSALLVQTDGDECVSTMDMPQVLDNLLPRR